MMTTEMGNNLSGLTTVVDIQNKSLNGYINNLKDVDGAQNKASATNREIAAQFGAITSGTDKASQATRNLGNASAVTHRTLQQNLDVLTGVSSELRMTERQAAALASQFGKIESSSSRLSSEFRELGERADDAGRKMHLGSSAMQEMERISRALMTGEFSLIPGELMTLTTRLGAVPGAVFIAVGSLAVLATAFIKVYEHLHRLNTESMSLQVGATMALPSLSPEKIDALFRELEHVSTTSDKTSKAVIAAFTTMRGATDQNVELFVTRLRDLTRDVPEHMESMAHVTKRAFESPMASMSPFLLAIGATKDEIASMNAVTGDDAPMRRRIMMQELYVAAANRTRAVHGNIIDQTRLESEIGDRTDYTPQLAEKMRASAETERLARNEILLANSIRSTTNETIENVTAFESWHDKAVKAAEDAAATAYEGAKAEQRATQTSVEATKARLASWMDYKSKTTQNSEIMEADKAIHRLRAQLEREEAADRRAALAEARRDSKQTMQEQLADLSRLQAEAGKDYAEVMRLEEMKIKYLESLGKEGTLALKNELKHRAELQNRHTEELLSAEQSSLNKQLSIDSLDLSALKRNLDAKYRANLITEQQMTEILIAETEKRAAVNTRAFESFLSLLPSEVKRQQEVADQVRLINARLNKDLESLRDDEAKKEQTRLSNQSRMWEQAADKIGSSMGTALTGIITRQTTMQKAMSTVVTSMISEFISMCTTMAAKWAVLKIAQVMNNGTATAVINAQNAGMGSGFGALVTAMLSKFTAGEATKTSAAIAGLTIRESAEIAAAETTKTVTAATNATTVMSDASKAAAGAYAAVAEIPVVGPVLAPIAAGTAFAAVAAFRMIGLDVGAWNVPKDMPAYIHQGEMVVPKNFAEGIRSNMGGGGGGGGGGGVQNFHFSPSITSSGGGSGGQTLNTQVMAAYSYFRNIGRNGAIALPGRPA
jgi:hypothetical protein